MRKMSYKRSDFSYANISICCFQQRIFEIITLIRPYHCKRWKMYTVHLVPNGIILHFEMSALFFKPVYGALKVENIWTPRDDPSFDGLLANRIVMGFSVTTYSWAEKCDISLSQKALQSIKHFVVKLLTYCRNNEQQKKRVF